MYLKTTLNTFEGMSFPVSFIDMSTGRAFLTCVPWINRYNRFSAFALKFRSKICVLCSHVFDGLAIEKSIIGSHGDINNSSINSKNLIANGFRRRFMNGHMQIKSMLLSIIAKCGSSQIPIKILPVIFGDRKNRFNPAFNRGKSNLFFRKVDSTNSFIIPDSRELFTFRKFFKFNSLESFAGNISYSLKNGTRKFRMLFSNTVISSMVHRYFAASMILKTVSGNLIKNLITQNHCLSKRFFAFVRQFQFKFNRSFHIYILLLIDANSLCFEGGVRFLPLLKYGVSSTLAPQRIQ